MYQHFYEGISQLVMVSDDRNHRIWEVDCRENVGANPGVKLHLLKLSRRKLPGLVQDVLGDGELSHVMEKRRCLNRLKKLVVRYADVFGESDGIDLNAADMPMGDLIFGVDCHRQCLDGRQVKAV